MNAIARKLLIKPHQRWLILNAPETILSVFELLPESVSLGFEASGTDVNGMLVFVKTQDDLSSQLSAIQHLFKQDVILWIIYPKKASGIDTDLTMTDEWEAPAKYNLRPVTAAAINNNWTALRFRSEAQVKVSATRNSQIHGNDYAAYIDVVNRQITLPRDIESLLQQNSLAYDKFMQLSYSNKKEYVLWILTAKQEKTKTDRLGKLVSMLLAGKKNPSDK